MLACDHYVTIATSCVAMPQSECPVSHKLAWGPWQPCMILHHLYCHDACSHPHFVFLNHSCHPNSVSRFVWLLFSMTWLMTSHSDCMYSREAWYSWWGVLECQMYSFQSHVQQLAHLPSSAPWYQEAWHWWFVLFLPPTTSQGRRTELQMLKAKNRSVQGLMKVLNALQTEQSQLYQENCFLHVTNHDFGATQ